MANDDDDDELNCPRCNYRNLQWFGIIQLSKRFMRCKRLSQAPNEELIFAWIHIIQWEGNVPTK